VRESLRRKQAQSTIEEEGQRLNLAVVPRDGGGAVVGHVTLIWTSREHRQGEVGFIFHPDSQGHGFATEAATALLPLGFEGLGLHRIVGRCDARNTASARVLVRLGMRREAHLIENELVKGEWTSELVYAILESEWRRRAQRTS
jgi:RimJ/RimL family protein N-acetyltransferase